MQRALASVLLLMTAASCGTSDSLVQPLMAEYYGEVLIRVVDAQGKPVAGAEVLVPPGDYEPSTISEFLWAGTVGRADRFGVAHEADPNGEVRIRGVAGELTFVARDGDRWGAESWTRGVGRTLSITVERDESARIACADAQGHPGAGALVLVLAAGSDAWSFLPFGEVVWGGWVTSADGSLDVPHAQHWRELQRQGVRVTIAAVILWSGEMAGGDYSRPFPGAADAPMSFVVSPSGWVEVRVDATLAGASGDLRWLDAPVDPEDPDDVPEFPICAAPSVRVALPLGHRYEVVFDVPGFVDPRIAFDGPKVAGERIEVVIDRLEPAAVVTARLVDESGNPLAGSSCTAWLDRSGERIEAEVDEESDAEGYLVFELPPGAGGTLHVELDRSRMQFGTYEFTSTENLRSAHVIIESLVAGETKVGDVVCTHATR